MIINNPYGFIYITTNLTNGKRYIGKKVLDKKSQWKSYLGSGIALKNAIKKYGKENFTKDIIVFASSEEELCDYEKQLILFYDAVNSSAYYNIASGGEGYNFFGTEQGDTSVPVYCIELNKVFKNSRIAEEITGENCHTIRTKCKTYRDKPNIRKGYHWCFISDIYSLFKCHYSAHPVVLLDNNKIYGSWNHAQRELKRRFTRRDVLTYESYCDKIKKWKSVDGKFLRVEDYLKNNDFSA